VSALELHQEPIGSLCRSEGKQGDPIKSENHRKNSKKGKKAAASVSDSKRNPPSTAGLQHIACHEGRENIPSI